MSRVKAVLEFSIMLWLGHAVAETPTGMARALFYIVSASPSFLHHQSYNLPYHTFHQVMSPDAGHIH